MKTFALTLAVLVLANQPVRAEYAAPKLRVAAVDGAMLVHPPEALAYPVRGPMAAGALELVPGTLIEVTEGTASFESDLHARIIAPGGSMFRISTADPEGRRGLRVSGVPDAAPFSIEAAGAKLTLRGGRVAVYDGGRVEVESRGVFLAPGSVLSAGESLTVSIAGGGGGMTPGDKLSLNLPSERGFRAPQVAAAFEPPGGAFGPQAAAEPETARPPEAAPIGARPEAGAKAEAAPAPKRAARHKKASGAMLASKPVEFDAADSSLRNAVGAVPASPAVPRTLQTPDLALQAPLEPGVPSYHALRERWPFSRNQTLGAAAIACMALLVALEAAGWRPR